MMFFSKKQKSSLEQAVVLVEEAMGLVYHHQRTARHMPTTEELAQLTQFEWVMWNNYAATRAISRTMHDRAQVELPDMDKAKYQRRYYVD